MFLLAPPGKKKTKPHSVHFFSGHCCVSACMFQLSCKAGLPASGLLSSWTQPLLPGLLATALSSRVSTRPLCLRVLGRLAERWLSPQLRPNPQHEALCASTDVPVC